MSDLPQAKELFQAPLEEKQRCAIQQNNRGWSGMHIETLDPKNQRVSSGFHLHHPGPPLTSPQVGDYKE